MTASTPRRRRDIYLLPSLFTTAGLFLGFFAVIQVTQGQFGPAAIALYGAMLMDMLDGRVARWTNTASDFGREYDSLVDSLAFGLAPALMMYFWSIHALGRAGWLIAFVYTAATVLRLARYNTQTSTSSTHFFGLPCPAAAAFMISWVWMLEVFAVVGAREPWSVASAGVTLLMAALMVSGVPFRSFKDFAIKERIPFVVLLAGLVILVLILFDPPRVLFAAALAYVLSGPLLWGVRRMRRKGG